MKRGTVFLVVNRANKLERSLPDSISRIAVKV